jgi:deoxyadenosine/deoxycytidine kinase
MPYIFSIEGNIGSGKSTLVSNIKTAYSGKRINGREVICVQEPVSIWNDIKDKSGTTILEKFYADQEKYAFPFQMMAYISRLAILKETIEKNPDAIIITERCTDTDKHVFAQMMYDSGKMEDINFAIYLKWYECFLKEVQVVGHVYVKTDPTTCDERIQRRSRTGEDGIPLEYLDKCHDYHENWLIGNGKEKLVLDGNHDIGSEEYIGFLNQIEQYIIDTTSPYHKYNEETQKMFQNHFC